MIVRFGYVAMSMAVKNASPSKTMTVTNFSKLTDREAAVRKLERLASENLRNTLRLLRHNRAYDIQLFRFSSKLIPLIGHELLEGWDPLPVLEQEFAEIGEYVRLHQMRTSFHPDHFTVLNTPRQEVLAYSIEDLHRHVRMLEAMGLDDKAKCNIHVGGTYNDKQASLARFNQHYRQLDQIIQDRLTLENDDKTYTALETLELCEALGIPMVLDLHHHQVNNAGEDISELWPRIWKTWYKAESDPLDENNLPPKIHISSPKSEKDPRAHADLVEESILLAFMRSIAAMTPRLDVMIEAKMKDIALFHLMRDLPKHPGVKRLDQASVEIG